MQRARLHLTMASMVAQSWTRKTVESLGNNWPLNIFKISLANLEAGLKATWLSECSLSLLRLISFKLCHCHDLSSYLGEYRAIITCRNHCPNYRNKIQVAINLNYLSGQGTRLLLQQNILRIFRNPGLCTCFTIEDLHKRQTNNCATAEMNGWTCEKYKAKHLYSVCVCECVPMMFFWFCLSSSVPEFKVQHHITKPPSCLRYDHH